MDGRKSAGILRTTRVKAAAALAFALALSCGRRAPTPHLPGVIVLGIDGMDPAFLDRHKRSLPHLSGLRREGQSITLRTTVPPQSPVAWSTLITGRDPSGHGIFDFVHRDPRTLTMFSSLAETVGPRWRLPLGPWELPLSAGSVRRFRQGEAFWQTLSQAGVPVTILRMPNNFPPVDCEGLSLAGMGTPDLRGTFGTFTYFSSDPFDPPRETPGGRFVRATVTGHRAVLRLEGPPNTLRRDRAHSFIDITVDVDPSAAVALFRAGEERLILKEKEWSGWIRVRFPLLGSLVSSAGMIRIYARRLHPHLGIYVSPVNVDPEDPGLPLSTPKQYSRELARAAGPYYTQGIAEDTAALRHGALDADEFAAQAMLVAQDHLKLLDYELARFESGLLFFHFFGVDQVSHMFWHRDEPRVLAMYRLVDDTVGRIRARAPNAELIVMSDHGFTAFDRAMHLNSWLRAEGLQESTGEGTGLAAVDWSRTQAYAAGLNGLYLNLAGREAKGVVDPAHRQRILDSLRNRLLAARDPARNARPVETVYDPRQIFHSPLPETAPDLIVGYSPGYRASWQTALGEAPPRIFEDNTDAWIGDHCVAAHRVPGVFLSSRKQERAVSSLEDLTAVLIRRFIPGPIQ